MSRSTINFDLCHGDNLKHPPVAPTKAWRRICHWSMSSSITFCCTSTHTSIRCCRKLFTSCACIW